MVKKEQQSRKKNREEAAEKLKASGNELLQSKDYAGAIEAYTKALALLGDSSSSSNDDDDGQTPSLRSILLSNRSHAYLSSGSADQALQDAESCVALQPTWPKAHVRRAKTLQQISRSNQCRFRDALEAYDDALAAAAASTSSNNSPTKLYKEIKAARKQCASQLKAEERSAKPTLSPEVASMGCWLTVPEGASILNSRCLTATLEPCTYHGVDDRTNTPIHATFTGDAAWPMLVPHLQYKQTGKSVTYPACFYIIGPCTLTKACAEAVDDMFRPLPAVHACDWPNGAATRTCPFCARAADPEESNTETYTMVAQFLIGRAKQQKGGFGTKLMMQLVCERCTRKRLLKSVQKLPGESDQEIRGQWQALFDKPNTSNSNTSLIDPLPRIRHLCEGSHAIKMSELWIRASNVGLVSSITLHAQARFQRMMSHGGMAVNVQYNSGSHNTPLSSSTTTTAETGFFDTWMSELDHRVIHKDVTNAETLLQGQGIKVPTTTTTTTTPNAAEAAANHRNGQRIDHQEFHVGQVARIKDLQKALGVFWNRHGADFRLLWSTWSKEEQQTFCYETGRSFVAGRVEHYNRRHTQYHHVQDPRPLCNRPFGTVSKKKLSILPELSGTAASQYDLMQLFRDRVAAATDQSWVAEDVALIAKLKQEPGLLPKLQYKEKDGSYLCDYMGLEDDTIGPFVVLVGELEAEYNATGRLSSNEFLDPVDVVKHSDYRNYREPFKESFTIWSARADGPIRDSLHKLLQAGGATCAVCYIYAAMRQTLLLEYLQHAAHHYAAYVGKDNPEEMLGWSYQGIAACYVCCARTQPDGSKLLCCSRCKNVNYCSTKCQRIDWARHKKESCVTSPNYVGTSHFG